MAITEEQRLARRGAIGSSDIGKILFGQGLEVYLSKVHDLETSETSEAMEMGNEFEHPVLTIAARRLGVSIVENVHVQGAETFFAANLDAVVRVPEAHPDSPLVRMRPARAMEAKYTGLGHLFGEPGTDQLPERVLVQTAYQMAVVTSLELVYVPVLRATFNRPRVDIYEAPRNGDLCEITLEVARKFWKEHVEPRIPPPAGEGYGESALKVLKRVRRVPDRLAQVDSALVLDYQAAAAAKTAAEKIRDVALANLIAAMGDAEGADWGDPAKIFSYMKRTRKAYSVAETTFPFPQIINRREVE